MTSLQIAQALGMAHSTVSGILARAGLGRLTLTEPTGPVTRYERRHAGELIHIDIKKLARIQRAGHRVYGDRSARNRGAGWEYVHVAVDDATRLAYVEVLTNERSTNIVGFLERALSWFAARGVHAQRVMTDNGPGYVSHHHAHACRRLGVRHLRARPYRAPDQRQRRAFHSDPHPRVGLRADLPLIVRARDALGRWLDCYNHTRPHAGLNWQTPAARLQQHS